MKRIILLSFLYPWTEPFRRQLALVCLLSTLCIRWTVIVFAFPQLGFTLAVCPLGAFYLSELFYPPALWSYEPRSVLPLPLIICMAVVKGRADLASNKIVPFLVTSKGSYQFIHYLPILPCDTASTNTRSMAEALTNSYATRP